MLKKIPTKRPNNYLLVFITALGLIVRIIQLDSNPPGLTWDEASAGYNAYSILKTARDEYGNFLPLSIRSFDDYKPALYTYLTVPFVAVFGLKEASVRFPSAILGGLSVPVMYLLSKELFRKFQWKGMTVNATDTISIISAVLFAFSPWSLQLSRAAFEGNIGLFFMLLGIYLHLRALRKGTGLMLSALSYGLSLYSYHSFRIVTPLMLIIITYLYWPTMKQYRKKILTAFVLLVTMALPIVFSLFSSVGTGSRLSMVTIFSGHDLLAESIERINYDKTKGDELGLLYHNRRIEFAKAALKGYLDHFSPVFLYISGDSGMHHHPVDFGMLYLVGLPFLFIGCLYLARNYSKGIGLLFGLLLAGPLPASITTGTPHPIRAIAMMPAIHIITAAGIVEEVAIVYAQKKIYAWLLTSVIIISYSANGLYYFHQYYVHTPVQYGFFWQSENKNLYAYLRSVEDHYDRIVVTYYYDQPYIYYLFFNTINPAWYQNHWREEGEQYAGRFKKVIGKYEFSIIDMLNDQSGNTLIVAGAEETPANANLIHTLYFPDDTIAYNIYERK